MLRLNFEKKFKKAYMVAWTISEGRVDQKQIINFVRPYGKSIFSIISCNISLPQYKLTQLIVILLYSCIIKQ